ncbi:MAG: hypothetical protein SCI25_06385 [Desulfuromonadales bacterium]|nr:hypothetical protein [Desulfuromonadales bacterium]MDW7756330.1 hypothetical protein [Desulfuromonadales bacterium]
MKAVILCGGLLLFLFGPGFNRIVRDPLILYGVLLATAFFLIALTAFIYPLSQKRQEIDEEDNPVSDDNSG